MSEDIHQLMCKTKVEDLHKIINKHLPSVGTKLNQFTSHSQEDWAMALTVKQNEGYLDGSMKHIATNYAKMRNGAGVSAYNDFESPNTEHGKVFTDNLEKIKEWQKGKGACTFHGAKPHAQVFE